MGTPDDRSVRGLVWEHGTAPADPPVPVRVYRPHRTDGGCLVWSHGGSWIRGSAADWHHACADLAVTARCTVVSVDYRLAPRHPHPAPLADVLAVLRWVTEREGEQATAIGGDSAGGTLAATAAALWRDHGRSLAAQLLAYPPLDPRCSSRSYRRYADRFPTRTGMLAAWRTYLGPGPPAPGWYRTPWEAVDARGAPPTVLAVVGEDPVADDVHDYARHLRAAGADVRTRVFPRLRHGDFLLPGAPHGAGAPGPNPLRRWLATQARAVLDDPHVFHDHRRPPTRTPSNGTENPA